MKASTGRCCPGMAAFFFGTRLAAIALVLMAATLACSSYALAAISKGSLHVAVEEVATGLVSPVGLTHAGDGRLFVVDQPGQIRVIKDGQLLPVPFLDVSAKLVPLNAGYDERGLLGLAFHPDYASNGKFYIFYSAPGAPAGWNHHSVVAEYTVSASPDVASTTERIILTIDKPQSNHNGGHMAFGPDGYLYIATGDGGGANDAGTGHTAVTGNAQDITNLLGKILRIDVDQQDPGLQYAIPPDNPYAGAVPGRDEIYAHGLRNPYSFSFDRLTGDLYAGDVGQNVIEEVDVIVKGGNYGWKAKEGTSTFDANLPQTGYIDPIAQYTHDDGTAVIGGVVYRGSKSPLLSGKYIFGDLTGRVFYIDPADPAPLKPILEARIGFGDSGLGSSNIKGFGEGADGEVYILASNKIGPLGDTSGRVLRVTATPIGSLRQGQPPSQVTLLSKQVSRTYQGRYYIQEADRSSGIAVILNRTYNPGDLVDVSGTLTTVGDELVISSATDVSRPGSGAPVPLGVNNYNAVDQMTEGLLVTVWGRVEATGSGGAFRIDDGTGLKDEFGNIGLRVYHGGTVTGVLQGSFVTVTGARGNIQGALGNLPVVYLQDASDLITN